MMSEDEYLPEMKRALSKRRGYADSRSWPIDRQVEELGIAQDFLASSSEVQGAPFSNLLQRPRGEDPPDLEMLDCRNERIALEITELVNEGAVREAAGGGVNTPLHWTDSEIAAAVQARLDAKDFGERLKGGPYFRYIVVLYTAEYLIEPERLRRTLSEHKVRVPRTIDAAYVSCDYEPSEGGYPLIQVAW